MKIEKSISPKYSNVTPRTAGYFYTSWYGGDSKTFHTKDELEDYKINELRFYVSASNLVTLTKYTGYDPTGSTGQPIGGGIDYGFYPTPKTYLFGLQLKF